MLSHLDLELQELLAQAKAKGTLTYEEVSRFLPDETLGTDRIDEVLNALDGLGIRARSTARTPTSGRWPKPKSPRPTAIARSF